MKTSAFFAASLVAASLLWPAKARAAAPQKPNIILFLADDLGYHELGCYGQTKIKTPNIDALAAEGVRFTDFYAGHAVCAPSRCALLTGQHTGHATVRDNSDGTDAAARAAIKAADGYVTQLPLRADDVTMAESLKSAGYATACIGKWGLGHPSDSGDPMKHGFDLFYGEYSQYQAHNYYPTYLWRNHEKELLPGNDGKSASGAIYAPDLMEKEALKWIGAKRDNPFFLYYATPVPHVSLQIPPDEPSLIGYKKSFEEAPPFKGAYNYTANDAPRATYAAMVTRMDRTLGKLRAAIKASGQEKNTIIVFASDNGASMTTGGYNRAFFEADKPLRGSKAQLWEGGIRVPTIVSWPGHIKPTTSDFVGAAWDFLPTLATLGGAKTPENIDGVSLLPLLLGDPKNQVQHEYLYWEMASGGQQAVRMGKWKGVRMGIKGDADAPVQLFDLSVDGAETTDVAARNPDVVARIAEIMRAGRTPNPAFPMGVLDKNSG